MFIKITAILLILIFSFMILLTLNDIFFFYSQTNLKAKLKILSLGRNQIKKIENLDGVSDTLEQLWLSYNNIEKLSGIEKLKKLKVLYISNNKVDKWPEFEKLVPFFFIFCLLFSFFSNCLKQSIFFCGL